MEEKFDIVKCTDEERIEYVINCIQEAVSTRDDKEINSYINQIAANIKNLLKECNKDTIAYLIIRFFNKLTVNAPTVRIDACEKFDEDLANYINNIEYEKYVLKELKKYLKYCSRSKEYDKLALSFGILIAIFILHNDRTNRMKTSIDVWECGIKGIRYIPVSKDDKMDELKVSIDSSLNILKRKK